MNKELHTQLNKIESLLDTMKGNDLEFLNIEEASTFLRLKKSTLYSLVFKRGIPFYKRTKRLLFKKSDLINWVEQKRISSYMEAQNSYSSLKGGY